MCMVKLISTFHLPFYQFVCTDMKISTAQKYMIPSAITVLHNYDLINIVHSIEQGNIRWMATLHFTKKQQQHTIL